jgi:dimethylargininase
MFTKAIVRFPAENFDQGISQSGSGRPDYAKALEQHASYCEALKKCGLTLIYLDADPRYPDSTFVEDTAIVTSSVAIIARPGDQRRLGEELAIGEVLTGYRNIEKIIPPGCIDGGDILQVNSHFFIGLSDRSNREGATQLQSILETYGYSSSTIAVGNMLHLKSGINHLGKNSLIAREEMMHHEALKPYDLVSVSPDEDYAANIVLINDYLLIPKGFPKTKEKLLQKGFSLLELDMSEFQKMDGGLSCLSLRF